MNEDADQLSLQWPPTVLALFERLAKSTERFVNYTAPALERTVTLLANLEQTIGVPLSRLAEQIEKRMAELPAIIREGLVDAAQHGWHIGGEMPLNDMEFVFNLYASGDIEKADEFMSDFITQCIPNLQKEIKGHFPGRWPILEPAFHAHERGEYVLAIPVFLSQSEGILVDKVKASWFQTKTPSGGGDSKPETLKFVSEQEALDEFAAAFLAHET